jgi:hypothetical protein
VHRVAHDRRWLGRIEHDDGLCLLGAADDLQCLGGGLGELVDVGSGARPADFEAIEATISA